MWRFVALSQMRLVMSPSTLKCAVTIGPTRPKMTVLARIFGFFLCQQDGPLLKVSKSACSSQKAPGLAFWWCLLPASIQVSVPALARASTLVMGEGSPHQMRCSGCSTFLLMAMTPFADM